MTKPSLPALPHEGHRSERSGWLRAAVLGSSDAIVSTASLMIGVAATEASKHEILVAGLAGLVAGAMSMAVGEFISVSSQRDAELADVEREKRELEAQPEAEFAELVTIFERRGLSSELARAVATELSAGDRLGAHLREELGLDAQVPARPVQAAWVSASSFAIFAAVPVTALLFAPADARTATIAGASLLSLALLGALGGQLGGAPRVRAAARVTVGGALAMLVTAGVGHILGVAVS
jgi:VIT1/CCC1 family predicted Fe2+/Mn2+ transporter